MISIITTIYNNVEYVEDALDSFVESCGNTPFEILVGIDNCEKTLSYLLTISSKLNKNIKLFFFTERVGTYIIRNTLVSKSSYEKIIFFDSDDVMRKHVVSNVINDLNNFDFVKFSSVSFSGKLNLNKEGKIYTKFDYHVGAFAIRKNVFMRMNGFEPWLVAADGEFHWRIETNRYKIKKSNEIDVLYRKHSTNLTIDPNTGMGSELRNRYHQIKKNKIKNNNSGPLSKLFVSDCVDLKLQTLLTLEDILDIIKKKELSIIIPTYDNTKYLVETINSIIYTNLNKNFEVLIGIDNCEKTLEFIRQQNFDPKVKFYFFDKKNGPYIVRNTLVTLSNSPLLLFFDSDDIMKEGMIDELMEKIKHNDFVKPMYSEFKDKPNPSITKTSTFGEGQFIIRKELFLQMNGFEPWLVAADSDFMKRLYKNNKKFQYTNNVVFYKRVHPNSLTQHKETNFTSIVRHEYFKKIQTKKDFGPLSKLHTTNYTLITPSLDFNSLIPNSLFFPKKNNKELLNQILSQGKRVEQIIEINKE